jgi:DNA-binding PadR family transcriptional regulator
VNTKPRMIGHADFHILLSLLDAERHGYGIIKEVQQMTDGTFTLGPGTLYGSIRRLTAAGLIAESAIRPAEEKDDERRRCYYRLTTDGRHATETECQRVDNLMRVVGQKNERVPLAADGVPLAAERGMES